MEPSHTWVERLYAWVAVPLLLLGAAMLIADIGATALWIIVITLACALVVISQLPGAMGRR
jgi:hypothetical protein